MQNLTGLKEWNKDYMNKENSAFRDYSNDQQSSKRIH